MRARTLAALGNAAAESTPALLHAELDLQSVAQIPGLAFTVGDPTTMVTMNEIPKDNPACCGHARFWDISRSIMHASALSIAMFWVNLW